MKISLSSEDVKNTKADLIAVPVYEGETSNAHLRKLGLGLEEQLHHLLKRKEFKGSFAQLRVLSTLRVKAPHHILLVGLGKKKEFTEEKFRRVVAAAHRKVKGLGVKSYLSLLLGVGPAALERSVYVASESMWLSEYSFDTFKTVKKDEIKHVAEASLWLKEKSSALTKALKRAQIVSSATNYSRDLVNMPPNIVFPAYLAKEAKKLGSKHKDLKVTVFGMKELIKMGCGGILAVGKGSAREPKMIILDYNPKGAKGSLAVIGKGITFDSGGLNIKPGAYMGTMKCDMSGSAVSIGVVKAAAELGIKKRVIGVMACAENMPSERSYRPDDIIKMYSGKFVEIGNTDAEGRMCLADALAYTEKKIKPDVMINFATLTGACVVALGYHTAGMMTTDDKLAGAFYAAGERSGDRVWRLPLWEDYKKHMDSPVADVSNISDGRSAGAITAGIFLQHFVEKTPWVHFDIAATAYLKKQKFYNPKHGTGAGVRLVMEYLGV